MLKVFLSLLLLSSFFLFSSTSVAQNSEDSHVVHVQTWKLKTVPTGDEGTVF